MRKRTAPPPKTIIPEGSTQPISIEMWPVDRPKDYPKNARKWGPKAVEKVRMSLREFGFRQPIVVDKDDVIIIGHLRRQSAREEGFTEVPVHVAGELTPVQCRQLRLMDNRSHEEARWDLDKLAEEMKELSELKLDMSMTGFDAAELVRWVGHGGQEDPDVVPQAPAVPASRTGDLWLLGDHRLLNGDCTDPANIARLLGDRKPTLMVTDPPYGIELDSEWRDRAGRNKLGPAEPSYMKRRIAGHSETTISGDTRIDWSQAFELVPSLEVAYVWHASVGSREVLNGLERIGFLYPQQIIWDKGIAVFTRSHYWYQHEPCWYVRKKNAPWLGVLGQCSTIWPARSPKHIMSGSKEEKFDHPTQKPVELMVRSIVNHLEAGGILFEPFGGSGTTLVAAEMTHRACCCTELDSKYVDVIVKRWQGFTGKAATLDGDGRTFEEISAERKSAPQEEPAARQEQEADATA